MVYKMKKLNKILIILFGVFLVLSLNACKTKDSTPTLTPELEQTPTTEQIDITEGSDNATKAPTVNNEPTNAATEEVSETPTTEEKVTVKLDVTYTSTTLENGTIEDTVEAIYDSVVAINSKINGQVAGSGSGVLFGHTEDLSFIVTCHHVIEGCNGFEVVLSNGTSLEAKLVGGDEKSDIAVLSVEATNLTYVSWFSDTDTLRLGSTVICIGNPLGTLPGSVSTGVVSYNNREISVDSYNTMKLIQTDVAINSGNSGGGLFNAAGALIGVVNAKYSSSGIEGLGFAIPANQARVIVDSILKTASYDSTDKVWTTGYVEGRWDIGFELGYGGNMFFRTSIGVLSQATNSTSSDYGLLLNNDLFNSIEIKYADQSEEAKSLTGISAQTMTTDTIYNFIYSSELSIGDTLVFSITRNDVEMTVEVELVQYRYYI